MFRGMYFLLTGLESGNGSVHCAKDISEKIVALGGSMLQNEEELYSRGGGGDCFLVAAPSASRRPKFLAALSLDIPILHPQWVLEAAHSATLPDPQDYLLAAGSSPLHPYFVFRDRKHIWEGGMLAGVSVLNLAGGLWDRLLTASGATISPSRPDSIVSYRKRLLTDANPDGGESYLPAFIVVDSLA